MVVHSQPINCAASEVAATVEGAVRHGTSMALEGNYVDSHGQLNQPTRGYALPRPVEPAYARLRALSRGSFHNRPSKHTSLQVFYT